MKILFSKKQIVLAMITSVFLAGGVFAQTEGGQEIIGTRNAIVQGLDNSVLFNIDLDSFNMDFTIEKIEEDSELYYVTYTYSDIVRGVDAWNVQVIEKVMKLSKKAVGDDLDKYVAKDLKQTREDRIAALKKEKMSLEKQESRLQVEKYSGLIGKTLDMASGIFPGYEPEKITVLPPVVEQAIDVSTSTPENLEVVYEEYVETHQAQVGSLENVASPTDEQVQSTSTPINEADVQSTSTDATISN